MTAPLNGKKTFGAGRFFAINNVTNPTPARFLVPQDMSATFKRSTKTLFGENMFAEDLASGEMNVTGKVTMGTTNARIFSDLVFGAGNSAGQVNEIDNELGTIATHIITVVESATWTVDLGVVNTATGGRYKRVAAASEAAGVSYSVAAGVYTFATGETGVTFKISYLYGITSTGETVTMTNQPMGRIGGFTAIYVFPWTNPSNVVEQDVLTLNSCVASDSEIATKMGDYAKPTFGLEAAVDTNEVLGTFTFAEAA